MKFELWLEFEEWESMPSDSQDNDFFNAKITLANGWEYALNIMGSFFGELWKIWGFLFD